MLCFLLQIIDGVRDEMIHLYMKFCSRNPSFLEQNGKVSIVAHSLGSVIAYDILTLWDIELRHLSQDATGSTGFLTESFQYLRSVVSRTSHEQTESGSGANLKENLRVKLAKARSEVMRLEAMVVSEVEHGKHGADKSSNEYPFALPFKVRDSFAVVQIYNALFTLKLKGAMLQFVHLEKFSLNFSSSSFVICVSLRRPKPFLFHFGLLLPRWCFSNLPKYYFEVSFNLKVVFYITINDS